MLYGRLLFKKITPIEEGSLTNFYLQNPLQLTIIQINFSIFGLFK